LNVVYFSAEAHFHLVGYRQNAKFAASENPRLTVANPLHPETVREWRALSSVLNIRSVDSCGHDYIFISIVREDISASATS
jgi:hypothetical protein